MEGASREMEGASSWDAIEWTKIEPVRQSLSHGWSELLLESEEVLVEGFGVILLNTDEAGTLLVTNFRLLFVSEGSRKIIALGTIPLATIEKFSKQVTKPPSYPRQSDKTPSRRLLQVIGKDMRIIVFGFRTKTKLRRAVFDSLWRGTRPVRLWDLYTFGCSPKFKNSDPKTRLLNEYCRLLGKDPYGVSSSSIEDGSSSISNKWWRISRLNSNYTMCPTYPFSFIVPECISDEEVLQASSFRARCRLPVISWCQSGTGAVLARSSQPLVGLMMNSRSNADEKLVAALCTQNGGERGQRRGYLAPEYAMLGHLTEKADVFGFRVVALEILSGKRNSYSSLDQEKIYLLERAWYLHENNRSLEVIDPTLSEFSEEEAFRVIGVALLCTQASPTLRPPMSRVVAMLSGDVEVGIATSRPGYLSDWQFNDVSGLMSGDDSRMSMERTINSQRDTLSSVSTVLPPDPMLPSTHPKIHEIINKGQ